MFSRYTGKFIPFKQKMHIKQGIKRKVYDNVRYTIPLLHFKFHVWIGRNEIKRVYIHELYLWVMFRFKYNLNIIGYKCQFQLLNKIKKKPISIRLMVKPNSLSKSFFKNIYH